MICGVRFCGGCNPKYDRGKFYEIIQQNFKDEIQFEVAQEDTIYDILLVIGGCTNCCASFDTFISKKGIIKIRQEEDLEKIIQILKDLNNI